MAYAKLSEAEADLKERQATGERVVSLLESLREASTEVVEARMERIEPLLQRIYSRIDPHPSFRTVSLRTRFANRRGRLTTAIGDDVADRWSPAPEKVLSSSQLNALAVSVFLALNLGVAALPVRTVMLDDPLQSLDDVNLLGLIDLLRRTAEKRQLIVSTHDQRFGGLLERKLRPIGSRRTVSIELSRLEQIWT